MLLRVQDIALEVYICEGRSCRDNSTMISLLPVQIRQTLLLRIISHINEQRI